MEKKLDTSLEVLRKWLFKAIKRKPRREEDKQTMFSFYTKVYTTLKDKYLELYKEKSATSQYKDAVLLKLQEAKTRFPLSEDELRQLQFEIEELSSLFDEESIFSTVPNIIKILIHEDKECCKDVLKNQLEKQEDIDLISEFGHYTIEALIVYEISSLFSAQEVSAVVPTSTLLDRLERSVRTQALLLKGRRILNKKFSQSTGQSLSAVEEDGSLSAKDLKAEDLNQKSKKQNKKKKIDKFPIGSRLVSLMVERELIVITNSLGIDPNKKMEKNKKVKGQNDKNEKGSYYIPKRSYVICNFDISSLPMRINLPMVYPPIAWGKADKYGLSPRTISDLIGGYLHSVTGEMYERYCLLSSVNLNNFYIDLSEYGGDYKKLCDVMNKLQLQAFQINSQFLNFLKRNEDLLVEGDFLKPRFLAYVNVNDVIDIVRDFYMADEAMKKICSFSEVLQAICKDIQSARYEDSVIKLSSAYEGYKLYLPAFLDFRGRIYRSGSLHFHERDLARSLILFADAPVGEVNNDDIKERVRTSTAFHYDSFPTIEKAKKWIQLNSRNIRLNEDSSIYECKRPFQFLAFFLGINNNNNDFLANAPITQDGSASAYQIMAYFLMNNDIAMYTNLIRNREGEILDVYTLILGKLKIFLKEYKEIDQKLAELVCSYLDRKVVKTIFMPKIYGKTLMSTAQDLRSCLSQYITAKESFDVAKACFKFWNDKFPDMECLIRLIRNISWIASAGDRPVFYQVPYLTTVQDYMIQVTEAIRIYDKHTQKRRQVSLKVPSSKRDRRKTVTSTFANFIHQKDANIAMMVVEALQKENAPIYTVHDNFITTPAYSHMVPHYYSEAFVQMGPPLAIINKFIYMNVIEPLVGWKGSTPDRMYELVYRSQDLYQLLSKHIPKDQSKSKREAWENKIKEIVSSYEMYTRIVCGGERSWEGHLSKWKNFSRKIESRGISITHNYCVHY